MTEAVALGSTANIRLVGALHNVILLITRARCRLWRVLPRLSAPAQSQQIFTIAQRPGRGHARARSQNRAVTTLHNRTSVITRGLLNHTRMTQAQRRQYNYTVLRGNRSPPETSPLTCELTRWTTIVPRSSARRAYQHHSGERVQTRGTTASFTTDRSATRVGDRCRRTHYGQPTHVSHIIHRSSTPTGQPLSTSCGKRVEKGR